MNRLENLCELAFLTAATAALLGFWMLFVGAIVAAAAILIHNL